MAYFESVRKDVIDKNWRGTEDFRHFIICWRISLDYRVHVYVLVDRLRHKTIHLLRVVHALNAPHHP
jgi:hypothetical protein